ncbi:hypothetical protein RFI_08653, partial [Reticulomyxa filosa]
KTSKQRWFGENGVWTKSEHNMFNQIPAEQRRIGYNKRNYRRGRSVLESSRLSPTVLQLIQYRFCQEQQKMDLNIIEDAAVRLLEEISPEVIIIIMICIVIIILFLYRVASAKIKKSIPGYFRGVCQKYWKQNREKIKHQLLAQAKLSPPQQKYGDQNELTPLVSAMIEALFTPASGLETSIIDESVEKRLIQLSDQVNYFT